ncbi:uncharacterized protein LOC143017742 isoform X2 [Oratosquilla oratoria]|uniref:uncharacterized protein LOC143017742 isoform X2 n=1 Tax=Oratosquilla oratoria TaxID=337810 RepID=UPI003F75B0EC
MIRIGICIDLPPCKTISVSSNVLLFEVHFGVAVACVTEAAARLTELERLLDEHDQIIRELKRSESQGSGINFMGCSSASSPGPQTPTLMPLASENSVSTPSLPIGKEEASTQKSYTSKSSVTRTVKTSEGSSGSLPVFKAKVDPPPPHSSTSSISTPCTMSTCSSSKPQTVTAASQTATTTTTTQSNKRTTASVPAIKVEERHGQDVQ